MSTKDANCSGCSLVFPAHHQLDLCCESACEKQPIRDYIEYLENRIIELESKLHEEKTSE